MLLGRDNMGDEVDFEIDMTATLRACENDAELTAMENEMNFLIEHHHKLRKAARRAQAVYRVANTEKERRSVWRQARLKGATAVALGSGPAWVLLAEPAWAPMQGSWGDNYLALVWQHRRWARVQGLLSPAAATVPAAAAVWVVPLECAALWARTRPVGQVEGFDLSAFNRLWPQREEGEAFAVPLTQLPHAPLVGRCRLNTA